MRGGDPNWKKKKKNPTNIGVARGPHSLSVVPQSRCYNSEKKKVRATRHEINASDIGWDVALPNQYWHR